MRELTVDDIFALYYTFDSIDIESVGGLFSNLFESLPLLESVTTCPWKVLVELGTSELKKIYELFLELNGQFFCSRKEKPKKDDKPEDFINNLFSLYCDLIESGHSNVLNYGYSFFLRAINNHERIKSLKVADMAIAIRTARSADDKQWKKYIRGLVRKNYGY